MSTNGGDMPRGKAQGHYTFDANSVAGLLSIVWREDGQPGQMMTTIAAGRVAALAKAARAWVADHPEAASQPGPVPGPRVRPGGPRGGGLSVPNDDNPEGTTR